MASIGTIFIDFVVRTAEVSAGIRDLTGQLNTDTGTMASGFAAVGASSDAMTNAIERGGLRVGVSLLGARSLAILLSKDIKEVYKDIDSIPGVPPETLESIRQMKYEFESAGGVLKPAIAQLEGWFAQIGIGLGMGAGALVYGMDSARVSAAQLTAEADKFARADHEAKMAKIQERIDKIGKSTGELADSYFKAAIAENAFAGGSSGTPGERWKSAEQAGQDFYEGLVKLNEEQAKYAKLMEQAGNVEDRFSVKGMGASQAVEVLRAKLKELHADQNAASSGDFSDWFNDPVALEKFNNDEQKIIATTKELDAQLLKIKEPMIELRDTFQHSFEGASNVIAQFVVTGKAKFGDFFKSLEEQIISTLVKLALINPILNQMFGGTKGYNSLAAFSTGTSLISGIAGFLAGGGPADSGKPYVVGEEGPELFIPNGSGTVIPNGARASMAGSGGATIVYNITSGVQRNDLAPILEQHSARIKGDLYRAKVRGGSPARAMA